MWAKAAGGFVFSEALKQAGLAGTKRREKGIVGTEYRDCDTIDT